MFAILIADNRLHRVIPILYMPKKWQFVFTEYFTGLIFHGKFPAECVTVNQVSDPGGVDLYPTVRGEK